MKGIVLAGGLGTRLNPLTKVTNKHLLPVYNQPMIYYPIQALVNANIDEILVVTGGSNAGDFLRLLGNGSNFGLKHINYAYQEGEGGIAAALSLAEYFANNDEIVVILGDNIIENNITNIVNDFQKQEEGARIVITKVNDPKRFGVPTFNNDNELIKITEKPNEPDSEYAVIGIYMYDHQIFDFIKKLKPSERGELEITDVNNFYIQQKTLEWSILDGWWADAGTTNSLLRASNLVAKTGANKTK